MELNSLVPLTRAQRWQRVRWWPSPKHRPEPSYSFERGESKKMHTLSRCRGELFFEQENHAINPCEFFSLHVFVCKY